MTSTLPNPTESIKNSYSRPPVASIDRSTLLRWANRTLKADQKTYIGQQRPMSLSRLAATASPALRRPLFLIGSPRSGTTFLGKCLASLSDISYHFEPIATKASARYVYDKSWSNTQAQWFYKSVYKWLLRIHHNGDLRFAEKTPRNCLIVPFLAQTFPDAQFIHIIRDGRDVALSLSKKPWFLASEANSGRYEPGGYPYGPYAQFWVEPERTKEFEATSDIHRCIWVWKRFTEAALESINQLPAQRYLEIRYESLMFETEKSTEQLKDFLEIKDLKADQDFRQAVSAANPSLSGQWKKQLSEQQLSEIYQEAKPLLSSLGYLD